MMTTTVESRNSIHDDNQAFSYDGYQSDGYNSTAEEPLLQRRSTAAKPTMTQALQGYNSNITNNSADEIEGGEEDRYTNDQYNENINHDDSGLPTPLASKEIIHHQSTGYTVHAPVVASSNKETASYAIDFLKRKNSVFNTKTLTVDFSTLGDKISRDFDDPQFSRDFGFYSPPTTTMGALSASTGSTVGRRLDHISLWELICLTSFNFPYGLICGTMGLFILPAEAQRLYPSAESIMLGISLGIVGVSQLVCPVAGSISDKMPGQWPVARRSPFILGGSICAGISVIGMWATSQFMLGWLYYTCLFCGMVALNVIYSVQCGLVPDLSSPELEGRASGVVAVNTISGSAIGFILMMATNHLDYHFTYPLYFVLLVVSGSLSLSVACRLQSRAKHEVFAPLVAQLPSTARQQQDEEERQTPETQTPRSEAEIDARISLSNDFNSSLQILEQQLELAERGRHRRFFLMTWREVINCYKIDVSHGYDFFWVFLGRTFYYVAVSCQAFMLYYLRDVIGTADPDTRKLQIGAIALTAQGLAASVAYPIGRWSDSENVNKKTLIYAAASLMATTYVCFMIAPVFGANAFWFVVATALMYGVGNGCFLAVDYALALATLPSKENSAQALGIWGVSAFLGSAIGPLLWGFLIDVLGSSPSLPEGEYLYRGYLAMLWGGVAVTILAGWIITFVKKTV